MKKSSFAFAVALVVFLATIVPAPAAVITIINNDGALEGFNDPTPVTPVGGNSGTTIGEQRFNAFQFAADRWAERLTSATEIRVDAQFDSFGCDTAFGVILGAAGATSFFRDFSQAPLTGTWYHAALADALAGTDLNPGTSDILAIFNSDVGAPGCALSWYYGFDLNAAGTDIDLVSVLIHELGHGLGFSTPMDAGAGVPLIGFTDVFAIKLEDHCTGRLFPAMTNGQRAVAARAGNALHWTGVAVADSAGDLIAGTHESCHVQMYAPGFFTPGSSVSHFSTALTPDEIMEPFYIRPNHNIERSLQLFADLGWGIVGGPVCGDLTADGFVTSSDALRALGASVGTDSCFLSVCDVNSSSTVTATDALLVLQYAVGQSVDLTCGATPGACTPSVLTCSQGGADGIDRRDHTSRPDDGTTRPEDGNTRPDDGTTRPEDGNTRPDDGNTRPDDGNTRPDDGNTRPDDGNTRPDVGNTRPEDGNTRPLDGGGR